MRYGYIYRHFCSFLKKYLSRFCSFFGRRIEEAQPLEKCIVNSFVVLDFSILCYRPWREEPGDESGGFVDGEMMDIFDVKITTLSSCRKTNERGRGAILK